ASASAFPPATTLAGSPTASARALHSAPSFLWLARLARPCACCRRQGAYVQWLRRRASRLRSMSLGWYGASCWPHRQETARPLRDLGPRAGFGAFWVQG